MNGDMAAPGGAVSFDDFSDFGTTSMAGAAAVPVTKARPKVVGGSAVGLNIGNSTIKVVELQAKGGQITVSAIGSMPTPAESLSNGVITSVGALEHVLRDLWKQAGVKSKRVVLSVAGTGALVVRVVEMPRMSDAELAGTMKTDVDRYIPFAPSEVIMDFKALRELPAPPDSPSMDVLIAAATREIIDQNVQLLSAAKLEPGAIEVEPLAVGRALTHAARDQGEINYGQVSAVVNIGADATEISVLRGDVLVFTRTIPSGGATLTRALVDYLGLPEQDAERYKISLGDALNPEAVPAYAQAGGSPGYADSGFAGATGDDWSEFGELGAPSSAPGTHNEPREQHGQQQSGGQPPGDNDPLAFDFADLDAAPAAAQTTPVTPVDPLTEAPTSTEASAVPEPDAFSFDLPEPTSATPPTSTDAFSFDFSLEEPAPAAPAAPLGPPSAGTASGTGAAPTLEESAWDLSDLGVPNAPDETQPPALSATPAPTFADPEPGLVAETTPFDAGPQLEEPSVLPTAPTVSPVTGDMDFDDLFGAPSEIGEASGEEAFSPSGAGGFDASDAALAGAAAGGVGLAAAAGATDVGFDDFGLSGQGAAGDGFGGSLTDDLSTQVDAPTIYAILHPLLDELANEIRRSLEYHASRYPDAVVQSITLVGGGAQLRNLDTYLTQTLGIPSVVGNPLHGFSWSKSQGQEAAQQAPVYAVAVGLALRNLLT
jgi:type IV pilus assembly protein PilM